MNIVALFLYGFFNEYIVNSLSPATAAAAAAAAAASAATALQDGTPSSPKQRNYKHRYVKRGVLLA